MNALHLPEDMTEGRVRIHLVGVGGTGSQVADQLASLQVTLQALGHPGFDVTVYDHDNVSASNVGRQRFTTSDIGQNKSVLLTHRINLFYGLDWTPRPEKYEPHHLHCELLITCVDTAKTRAIIGKTAANRTGNSLWLDFGNGQKQAQCVLGHLGKPEGCLRVPNIYDLFPELANMQAADAEAPSCSAEQAIRRQPWPINRVVTTFGMELLWSLFRHGSVKHHGYFLQLDPIISTPLPVDADTWSFYGYTPPQPKDSGKKAARRARQ